MPKKKEPVQSVKSATSSEMGSDSEGEFEGKFPSGNPVRGKPDRNSLKDADKLLSHLISNGAAVRGTMDQDGNISFEFHSSPAKGTVAAQATIEKGGPMGPPPRYETLSVPRDGKHRKKHGERPRGFFFR